VVAVVLCLALQNTLADVFAGIAVGIERPFQVGDQISFNSIEGQVTEINWRSIRIQTDGDDIAIIPNSLVAKQLHHARLLAQGQIRGPLSPDGRTPSVILPARQILRELLVFECLQPEQIDALAHRTETRLLEPGEILFAQGASDATLYVVASGIVEVTRETETSSTVALGCLGAGEYIGEICLLTGAPHAATARARTHCYIHQLSGDAIGPLLAANAEMAAAFDKSVRRGLDILQRSVAARAAEHVGAQGQLLQRIRAFFHFRPAE